MFGSSIRFETVLFDIERSTSKFDLRSGQGQVMTEVDQYAYLPKRIDEPSRLALFLRLYLHPVECFWRKPDFDLISPPRDPQSSVAPGSSQMG